MKDGFIRIGCCSPTVRVCGCSQNAEKIISLAESMYGRGVRIAVFPELCVTGYTCGDLFGQSVLLNAAENAVAEIIRRTAALDMLIFVGAPVAVGTQIFSCAAAISRGRLVSLTAKENLAEYSEFYEKRTFSPAPEQITAVKYAGFTVPFGKELLLECEEMPGFVVGAELCEDLTAPMQPSQKMALDGAVVIVNLAGSSESIGKDSCRRNLVAVQSGRLACAYAYASSGEGESTGDAVFSGHCLIGENNTLLAQQRWQADGIITADIDIARLAAERRRVGCYRSGARHASFSLTPAHTKLERRYSRTPFVPEDAVQREQRCEEILTIQSHALATRLSAISCRTVVLGLSGGLDSTLALIACVRTFDKLRLDRKNIIAVTMPCFGTTGRTRSNACRLAEAYGVTLREIPIAEATAMHLRDIGHDIETTDVTYENAQARERTQILMDIANMTGGIVLGTGDLSEVALGWSTYNGDHMSMYGINCSVPKTLIRYIVLHEASRVGGELGAVLRDVFDTPVSPELLPPKDGEIAQKTEDIVGPYELHDFFLYHFFRYGCEPTKLYRLARHAFGGEYDGETVKRWLILFLRRFFTQQFKRSCVPDGPKVGSVALSPRGDWRMPSDAVASEWLRLAEAINTKE